MASSVEFGPGIRLTAPTRSRKRSSLSQARRCTSSRRIIAMCATGPPKAIVPRVRNTRATSRSRPRSSPGTRNSLPHHGRVAGLPPRERLKIARVLQIGELAVLTAGVRRSWLVWLVSVAGVVRGHGCCLGLPTVLGHRLDPPGRVRGPAMAPVVPRGLPGSGHLHRIAVQRCRPVEQHPVELHVGRRGHRDRGTREVEPMQAGSPSAVTVNTVEAVKHQRRRGWSTTAWVAARAERSVSGVVGPSVSARPVRRRPGVSPGSGRSVDDCDWTTGRVESGQSQADAGPEHGQDQQGHRDERAAGAGPAPGFVPRRCVDRAGRQRGRAGGGRHGRARPHGWPAVGSRRCRSRASGIRGAWASRAPGSRAALLRAALLRVRGATRRPRARPGTGSAGVRGQQVGRVEQLRLAARCTGRTVRCGG